MYTQKKQSGAILLEAVIALGVFGVIATTSAAAYVAGMVHTTESRLRLAAVAVANQHMEQLRNLSYNDVAVVGGVPAGDVLADTVVTYSGRSFHVTTDVRYADDPFDGTVTSTPQDLVPTDYKIATIVVGWGNETPQQQVSIASRIVPPGYEQSSDGGVLAINVLDTDAHPIPHATVIVTNDTVTPPISLVAQADPYGQVVIPGTPAAESYHITAQKSGYRTMNTLPPYPATSYQPSFVHQTVLTGLLTAATMTISKVRDMTIRTQTRDGTPISSQNVHITGGQVIGLSASSNDPVFATNNVALHTDTDGEAALSAATYGTYKVTWTNDPAWVFFGVEDDATENDTQFVVTSERDTVVPIVLLPHAAVGLYAQVHNLSDDTAIAGASVTIRDAHTGTEWTGTTNTTGKVYITGSTEHPLEAGSYTISISANGYHTLSRTYDIAQTITIASFDLTAQ